MTSYEHSSQNYSSSIELPPGFILANDYRIEKTLGMGGFGITYLAFDLVLNRKVVIKENFPAGIVHRGGDSVTVYSSGQDQDSISMVEWARDSFLKEAQTLATLDHPNIVKILRAFAANGTAYFIMPFIEGYVLKDHVAQQIQMGSEQLPLKIKEYLNKMLDALSYLHGKGILHRDIKPDNILVTKDGEPLLIDFGAARAIDSQNTMTQIGSPGYMPFEQGQTKGNVGPWSDIYSLGATFYTILTGTKPESSLDRIMEDTQERLHDNPYLLRFYEELFLSSIDKAMFPLIEERYQNSESWYEEINGQALKNKSDHAFDWSRVKGSSQRLGSTSKIPGSKKKTGKNKSGHSKTSKLVLVMSLVLLLGGVGYLLIETDYIIKPLAMDALSVCMREAKSGDPKKQYDLALYYLNGREGLNQSTTKAIDWLRKSAKSGYQPANLMLGRIFLFERHGVSRDESEAYQYIKDVSVYGDADLSYELARMLEEGKVCEKNIDKAMSLYSIVADKKSDVAFKLSQYYKDKDPERYSKYLVLAAKRGHPLALFLVGEELMSHGDRREAQSFFERSANRGVPEAQYAMVRLFFMGERIDSYTISNYLNKAVEAQLPEAICMMGSCYQFGMLGFTKDLGQARVFYEEAAKRGLAEASECLNFIKNINKQ